MPIAALSHLPSAVIHLALCCLLYSWGAFEFCFSANADVALCSVMLLMCGVVFWAPICPRASCIEVFSPLWRRVFSWWFVVFQKMSKVCLDGAYRSLTHTSRLGMQRNVYQYHWVFCSHVQTLWKMYKHDTNMLFKEKGLYEQTLQAHDAGRRSRGTTALAHLALMA